jgi:hypothetical protein
MLPRDRSNRLIGAITSRTAQETPNGKQRESQQNNGFYNIRSFVRVFRQTEQFQYPGAERAEPCSESKYQESPTLSKHNSDTSDADSAAESCHNGTPQYPPGSPCANVERCAAAHLGYQVIGRTR